MKGEKRRSEIIRSLEKQDKPLSGNQLAETWGVSRQVIVHDIAILRAQGKSVVATPQGYLYIKDHKEGVIKTVAIKHENNKDMEEELKLMVDYGAEIIDVIVEHPVYGEIKGNLNITNRYDVEAFLKKIEEENAKPLAELTEGVHMHTLRFSDEKTYLKLMEKLKEKNFLIND